MAHRAIGLDIGSSALRAAQLSFSDRAPASLEKFGQVLLPPGAVEDGAVVDGPVVTAALKQLWRSERFASRTVHLGVANQRVIVRQMDLPDLPDGDFAEALPFQVQDVLPIPVESAVLTFHLLERLTAPNGARVQRGLLVAASREMLMANVAAVQAAGLTAASIDLIPFAVIRAVGGHLGDGTGVEALVDIGARVTNLVVHAAGAPYFVRILLTGGADLTEAFAEDLGTTLEEAEERKTTEGLDALGDAPRDGAVASAVQQLLNGICSSLDYHTSSHPLQAADRVVLSGGGSLLAGLPERIAEATGLPVRVADATARVGGQSVGGGLASSPSAAVPVGLALGAVL